MAGRVASGGFELRGARLDRYRRSADRVIVIMRKDGASLHCSHEPKGDRWWLSNGSGVSSETAELVILNADIVLVGDALFRNTPGQTFRVVK